MIALRGFIGAGCGVQDVVILPRVREAEVFRGAQQVIGSQRLARNFSKQGSRPDVGRRAGQKTVPELFSTYLGLHLLATRDHRKPPMLERFS